MSSNVYSTNATNLYYISIYNFIDLSITQKNSLRVGRVSASEEGCGFDYRLVGYRMSQLVKTLMII